MGSLRTGRGEMPDREAIIEAMHHAMVLAGDKLDPHIKVWPMDATVLDRFVNAAYDASPLERYRKALEEIADDPSHIQSRVKSIAERALRGEADTGNSHDTR